MRGFAYFVAVVAAVGIMIGIGSMPVESNNDPSTRDVPDRVEADINRAAWVFSEAGALTLDVPTMHCEFACFPRVKEALEGAAGVRGVELAEQQEEGVIDNRQVIVSYDAGFDAKRAMKLLAEEGYESEVVQ